MQKSAVRLTNISNICQNIAEAINSAFNYDVEVVDAKLVRIAATGPAKMKVGQRMKFGTSCKITMSNAKARFSSIDKNNSDCLKCKGRDRCLYQGGIVAPIINDGEVIGTIMLSAYNKNQIDQMTERKDELINFLEKMSSLLVGKLLKEQTIKKEKKLSKKLQLIMNSVAEGIIFINEDGFIEHANLMAKKIIASLTDAPLDELTIQQLFEDIPLAPVLAGSSLFGIELQSGGVRFIASSIKPVEIEGNVAGIVICIGYYNEIARSAYEITNSDRPITFDDIIYQSESMGRLVETCKNISASSSTVLIYGESGTGKEMYARAIHSSSSRSENAFIPINCGALPETLIESELFGYESGSFTGAKSGGKMGKFEIADKGTIFLDEIATMPLYLQSKLLRVLQERKIFKIGGTGPKPIDVRVIAATNENLKSLIDKGLFRSDLYYRLNVIPLSIPPLRNRREDIISLTYFFINKYDKFLNKKISFIDDRFRNLLENYEWPGNVRELENMIEYIINLAPKAEKCIRTEWIPGHVLDMLMKGKGPARVQAGPLQAAIPKKQYEMQSIRMLLEKYGDSTIAKKRIAGELGISLSTLYRKLSSMDKP